MTAPRPPRRTYTAGSGDELPAGAGGVRWSDGTVECRFRLTHPAGSLIAEDGEVGTVLTGDVECTACSDACAG